LPEESVIRYAAFGVFYSNFVEFYGNNSFDRLRYGILCFAANALCLRQTWTKGNNYYCCCYIGDPPTWVLCIALRPLSVFVLPELMSLLSQTENYGKVKFTHV